MEVNVQARICGLLLGALGMGGPSAADETRAATDCAPVGELSFLCGMQKPEDLAVLPGDRWIVASGMSTGSGLHLIDGETKTWERWIAPVAAEPKAPFDNCPSQPLPGEFRAHGISVRVGQNGQVTLYAVNHGGPEELQDLSIGRGHETIEVFDVDMTGPKPALSWLGCVSMPGKTVANSVASRPDGSLFATVLLEPDYTFADLAGKIPTGAVYRWEPGMAAFERMAGTELVGNNGIEVSLDGEALYVVGRSGITSFTSTIPVRVLKSSRMEGVIPDNIHWVNDHLILAGARTDVCGPSVAPETCIEGYFVSAVDPDTLELISIAKGPANDAFSGVSAGLPVGDTLWLGSYSADRVAYRTLP